MKPDRTVLRETVRLAAGVAAMAAVMLVIYAVVGRFSAAALLGCLYTSVLTVVNFFVMGLTVQGIASRAAEKARDDEELQAFSKQMEARMKLSRSGRMVALFALIVLGITVFKFDALASILPIVFPTVVIRIMQILDIKKASASKGSEQL